MYYKPGKKFDPLGTTYQQECVFAGFLEQRFAEAISMFGFAFLILLCMCCSFTQSTPDNIPHHKVELVDIDVELDKVEIGKIDALMASKGNLIIFHGNHCTTYEYFFFLNNHYI